MTRKNPVKFSRPMILKAEIEERIHVLEERYSQALAHEHHMFIDEFESVCERLEDEITSLYKRLARIEKREARK